MEEHGADLTGLAITAAAAVLAGLALRRLGQPAVVGYILAGIALGPSAAGLVSRSAEVGRLAELGVILLLFLIGMELSLKTFVRVLRPAALTALGQIAASLAIAYGFGWALGWPVAQSLVIGFIIALSSTAVAITVLDQIGELRGPVGQITIGVMIAQDIAVVPILVLVESLGAKGGSPVGIALRIVIAVGLLALLIAWLTQRGKLTLPFSRQLEGKVDLMTLAALAICFAAASVSGVLGLSPVYGAFCAGLVLSSSTLRTEMVHVTEPVLSVLMVVFFLSVGLLIDIGYVWANLGTVLLFTLAVLMLKSALNVALLKLVGEPWERALQGGLIMAQIGEFSFVLAAAGLTAGALSSGGHRLAIAVIAASLLLSPVWADAVRRFQALAQAGITDWRECLAEGYAGELAIVGRGAAPLERAWRGARAALWALREAGVRRRRRRTAAARATDVSRQADE
jgi:CPA2 family monovalent cation:H+ antiporter-2